MSNNQRITPTYNNGFFMGLNREVAYGTLTASLKYTDANKISIIITMNPIITFVLLVLLIHFEAD
ncbi:MAG: hypothetical protein JEZ14_06410 [Marinilabiliaceae bacterium]|nr:hypothetical protein [Marinilabiliaceae bacterium]